MSALLSLRSSNLEFSASQFPCHFTQRNKPDVFGLGSLANKSFDGWKVANVLRVVRQHDRELGQARVARASANGRKHLAHQRVIQTAGVGYEMLALYRRHDELLKR